MLHSAAHKNNKKLVLGETPLLSLICSSSSSSFGLSGHHRASLQCNSTSVAGSLAGFCKVCEVQELFASIGNWVYIHVAGGWRQQCTSKVETLLQQEKNSYKREISTEEEEEDMDVVVKQGTATIDSSATHLKSSLMGGGDAHVHETFVRTPSHESHGGSGRNFAALESKVLKRKASDLAMSEVDGKNFVVPLAAAAAISKGGRREVENHTKESEQRSENRKRMMMSSERKRSPIRYMEGQDHHNRVKENSKESNRYMDSGRETKQQQLRSRVVENCTTGWRRNDEDVAKERQARGGAEFKDDELPNRVVENCTTCSSRRNSSGDVGKERYARGGGGGGGRETKEVLESSRIVENCTSGSRRNDEVIQKEEGAARSQTFETRSKQEDPLFEDAYRGVKRAELSCALQEVDEVAREVVKVVSNTEELNQETSTVAIKSIIGSVATHSEGVGGGDDRHDQQDGGKNPNRGDAAANTATTTRLEMLDSKSKEARPGKREERVARNDSKTFIRHGKEAGHGRTHNEQGGRMDKGVTRRMDATEIRRTSSSSMRNGGSEAHDGRGGRQRAPKSEVQVNLVKEVVGQIGLKASNDHHIAPEAVQSVHSRRKESQYDSDKKHQVVEQRSKVTEKLRNANGDESQGQADKPEVKKEDKAGEPPSRKRSRVSGDDVFSEHFSKMNRRDSHGRREDLVVPREGRQDGPRRENNTHERRETNKEEAGAKVEKHVVKVHNRLPEGAKPRKPKEELSSRSHSKISTKRDYIKGSDKSTHEPRMQGHERTASQSASGLPRKHRSPSHRKKSTRSKSPHRNGSGEPGEWEKIERERAAMPAFSDSRYRRFGGGTSGLGGYSPRRRRSEAAIKTPSPPPRSPERRKPRAWDLAPPGIDSSVVAAMAAAHAAQQAAAQQAAALVSVSPLVSVNTLNSVSTTSGTAASVPLAGVPSMIPSILQQVSPAVVAVTLTQATRPLRRLYVGNVPSTVSDGELLEFMNAAMLSVNANHLAGTKPCISCSVNVEKAYAFAEFITPEDATVALAFDGVTLHGTTLKIRRPKDFIPPANGGSEIAQPKIDLVSSVVADSPHKVFLGGISSSLTSDKVKEIVTAFGQLKAYHWEVDTRTRPPQSFAFLEYLDPMVTLRACAGLNGMRLGSTILTVVQATPDAGPEAASAETPFYGVPEQAKPLLQTATRILELRNLVTEEEILAMTEEDVKELMEDVRLECLRFGTVKSMHIIKPLTPDDPTAVISEYAQASQLLGNGSDLKEVINSTPISPVPDSSIVLDAAMEPAMHITNDLLATGGPSFSLRNHLEEPNDQKNIEGKEGASAPVSLELTSRKCVEADEKEKKAPVMEDANRIKTEDMTVITIRTGEGDEKVPGKVEDVSSEVQDLPANTVLPEKSSDVLLPVTTDISVGENLSKEERERTGVSDCGMFNMGRLYVEFSREETACQAAHTLHGRMYGNHKVVVCYFPVRLYQKKFRKGLVARTYEEKQALALAVQGHLTAHIKE